MDEGLLRTIKEKDFMENKWAEEAFCPSADEIFLAVFLGRDNIVFLKINDDDFDILPLQLKVDKYPKM